MSPCCSGQDYIGVWGRIFFSRSRKQKPLILSTLRRCHFLAAFDHKRATILVPKLFQLSLCRNNLKTNSYCESKCIVISRITSGLSMSCDGKRIYGQVDVAYLRPRTIGSWPKLTLASYTDAIDSGEITRNDMLNAKEKEYVIPAGRPLEERKRASVH